MIPPLPKLPVLTGLELAKVIEKLGFSLAHQSGSHRVYKHPDGRMTVIPVHRGEEIGPGLLNKIIKRDLRMTREDFFKLI